MTVYGSPREVPPDPSGSESEWAPPPVAPRVVSEPVRVSAANQPPQVGGPTGALPGVSPGPAPADGVGEPVAPLPAQPPVAARPPAIRDPFSIDLGALPGAELLDEQEPPEIQSWDRRPMLVAIAAATVLVVLGVAAGAASASWFGRDRRDVGWRAAQPAATTSAPAAPVTDQTITLSGVGDVIMGSLPDRLPPRDGAGFFDLVKADLAADLVMGNLETPLTEDTGRRKCGYITPSPQPGNPSPAPIPDPNCYQFYLPPRYAQHLRDGGFQVLNLANNHTSDMGAEGLANTKAALSAAGLAYTGAPNQITQVTVNGVKIAVLGFGTSGGGQNLNNIPAAVALVKKAAQSADLVIVQMQGGAEGVQYTHVKPGNEFFAATNEYRGDLIKFSHAVVDAGADAVFGHGPHVMRGMEFYRGRLIAYSLGNFCGYGRISKVGLRGVGAVLRVTLNRDGSWVSGKLVATEMATGKGVPAPDPKHQAWNVVDELSRADFGAAAARVSMTDGSISQPAG